MHDRRTDAHDQGPAHARGGVPGKACRDRFPWVLSRDRGPLVTKEMAHSVSQHGLWCRDKGG